MHMYPSGNIIYYHNLTQSSDIRLKENIKNVDKSKIENLYKLNAIEYNYRNADTIQVIDNVTIENKRKMYGFSAQEMQEILPDFVHNDDEKYLSVDYISLIPILVEALKEQKKQIAELEKKIMSDKKASSYSSKQISNRNDTFTENDNLIENTVLYQNTPNPFSEQTEIRYVIPDDAKNAKLYIFNMQGKLIKIIEINQFGNGSIVIQGYQFEPGMYIYTLIVNGTEVDTKRMILTK